MSNDDLIPAPDQRYILKAIDCIKRAAESGASHPEIERLLSSIDTVERAKRKPMERAGTFKRREAS